MSEIQSAEALASDIRHQTRRWEYDEEQGCDVGIDEPTLTLEESTDLIRARDKAIVELCRGAIRKTIDAYFGMGSGVCKDCELAFDDVLCELGGEQ
jgi:hypothetical protein